jgi:hypothetical protein
MGVRLCTIATDLVHLVDIPLTLAQVDYHVVTGSRGMAIIYVGEDDIDRARLALDKFGRFAEE